MRLPSQPQSPIPSSLRQQLAGFALLCLSTLGLGYLLLQFWWPFASLVSWLLVIGVVLGYQAVVLWRSLPLNHREGESGLLPYLEMTTTLALIRGILFGLLAGFAVLRSPPGCFQASEHAYSTLREWAPGLLYVGSCLVNLLEAYLACRIPHGVTLLNKKLDVHLDVLALLIASAVGVVYKQLPGLYILVPLIHGLFIVGIWWRERRRWPIYELPFSLTRCLVIWIQKGFLCIALWPTSSGWQIEPLALLLMAFWVIRVTQDWLIVSGVLKLTSPLYQRAARLADLVAAWAPLGLRMVVVVNVLNWLSSFFAGGILLAAKYPEHIWVVVLCLLPLMLIRLLILAVFALGLAGRIVAAVLLLLALLGYDAPSNITFLICVVALLHLGTGRLSWWTENRWLTRLVGGPLQEELHAAADYANRKSWRAPMPLGRPIKVLVGLVTLLVISLPYVQMAHFFWLLATMPTVAGGQPDQAFIINRLSSSLAYQVPFKLAQLALTAFYLVHAIRNASAMQAIRIILGVGSFFLSVVAMPIYYYLYIWRDRPPAWALARSTDSEARSQDTLDSGSSNLE